MKSTLLASTALALVLSTGVAFAGPTATTNQGGSNNDVYIEQAGAVHSDTSASVTQDTGNSNYAQVHQLGAGKSLATIHQIGGDQSGNNGNGVTAVYGAVITQNVNKDAVADATITQNGDKNRGEISQAGGSNIGWISQDGSKLSTDIVQDGVNTAYATQSGSENTAGIDQRGTGNYMNVTQKNGSGNTASLSQGMDKNYDPTVLTANAVLWTSQTGKDGSITTYQTGTGGQWASISQSGQTKDTAIPLY